ncbi:hypothetical protein [Cohnella rhizosphaerae]|uniref:Uncharacterized protein n=1 Tax=Cohnella rhizosphaerae TaxID=1457232 RepID=A0A9X4QQZ7_9BACL|nr:hypothetical protein [Cohnella rhizosphaerae]MDG0808060.1 hypothetical protein [Cohnella rhizosphaerae]
MWLQGGPFLEISLLIQEDKIYKIITRLSNHKSVSILEENLEDKINQFEIGYLYDEQDSSSNRIHSTSINILANIQCKRKSVIYISKVAKDTILLNFCFFGSEFDAPEWGQLGIKKG